MLRNAMFMSIFLQKSCYHPVFHFEFREAESAPQSHTDSGGGGLVPKLCLTLATPWTVACQAPLPMGFSRQGYWSGLPFLSPGDLPDPGIRPGLLHCRQILYQLSYEGSLHLYLYLYLYLYISISIYIYIYLEVYLEFSSLFMEAEKFHNLLPTRYKARKASGIIQSQSEGL